MHQVCEDLRGTLDRNVMLIGKVRRPGLDCRAILHCLRYPTRKCPGGLPAAVRTYFDFGAMRRDNNPHLRNIEHLTLFIPHRLGIGQWSLTMRASGCRVRFGAFRMRRSLQGMAFMARLPTVGLLAGLP